MTDTPEWKLAVHYPINNYDVALNIGEYQHFARSKDGEKTSTFTRCRKTSIKQKYSSHRSQRCSTPLSTTSANIHSTKMDTS